MGEPETHYTLPEMRTQCRLFVCRASCAAIPTYQELRVLDMSHNGLDGAIVLDTGLGVLLQSCIRLESKQLEPMIIESCMLPLERAIPVCPHVVIADGLGSHSVVPGVGCMPSLFKHSQARKLPLTVPAYGASLQVLT